MDIQLSIGMASNPRTWAIHDGRIKPDGIELIPSPVHASELFWRQLKFGDFDVSEMSFSSLIMAMAAGDDRSSRRAGSSTPAFSSARTPASSHPPT